MALLLGGCEAPRDNPYDPESENYLGLGANLGSISGRITRLSGQSLLGAVALAAPTGGGEIRGAQSNSQGYYSIEDVAAGQYQVVCSLQGYAPDSLAVAVLPNEIATDQDFRLDALPIVYDFQVTSHYHHQTEFPILFHAVRAQASLSEPDGLSDVDFVALELEGEPYGEMSYDSANGSAFYYSVIIPQDSLPGQSVDSVMGKYFSCFVADTSGNMAVSSPATIRRYFLDYPDPQSPKDNVIEYTSTPWLWWDVVDTNFYFTYTAAVYRDTTGVDPIYWRQDNIPAEDDSVRVAFLPNNNDYYWTIQAVDLYGNTAQGEKAYFQVNGP